MVNVEHEVGDVHRHLGFDVSLGDAHGHSPSLMSATTVSVVIPITAASKGLSDVLARIPDQVHEIVVVDGDPAHDRPVSRHIQPPVITLEPTGGGRGNALACGFWASSGEIIVTLEADGTTDPAEIPRFVAALLAGADFAKGSRFLAGGGTDILGPLDRMFHRSVSAAVGYLWGVHYSDICYGYNAFWHHCLPFLFPDCRGFEAEALLSIRAARAGLRVQEVPSLQSGRASDSGTPSPPSGASRILRTIVAERIRPS